MRGTILVDFPEYFDSELRVEYYYKPGYWYPYSMPNGDPGHEPEPPEVNIIAAYDELMHDWSESTLFDMCREQIEALILEKHDNE